MLEVLLAATSLQRWFYSTPRSHSLPPRLAVLCLCDCVAPLPCSATDARG